MIDDSTTGTFQMPRDLLTEALKRQAKPQGDPLVIEGWRTTWLSRVSEFLLGKEK